MTLCLAAPSHVAAPSCGHFGRCGGCLMQHWPDHEYAAAKTRLLETALTRAGFPPTAASLWRTGPGTRRRMDLALRREGASTIAVGLHAVGSATVVDLHECRVLDPRLFAVLAPLRRLLPTLSGFRREGSAVVNLLDGGPRPAAAPRRADHRPGPHYPRRLRRRRRDHAHRLRRRARRAGGRLPARSGDDHVLRRAGRPAARRLPAGLASGRAGVVDAVLAGLPVRLVGRAWIAELFAGCGTLTFALARRARVVAFEGDAAAIAALQAAANSAGLGGRIETRHRDLKRRPVLASELARCAAVVLDPPQAGAASQIPELTRARPERIVYVSCNPESLGTDAARLHAAGYRLLSAIAIDQFLWSARVESVCVFAR